MTCDSVSAGLLPPLHLFFPYQFPSALLPVLQHWVHFSLTIVFASFATLQGRPCRRCIKRNIPNLCHDEPREPVKRLKTDQEHSTDEDAPLNNDFASAQGLSNSLNQAESGRQVLPDSALGIPPPSRTLPEGSQALQPPAAALGQDLDGNTQSRKTFPIPICFSPGSSLTVPGPISIVCGVCFLTSSPPTVGCPTIKYLLRATNGIWAL